MDNVNILKIEVKGQAQNCCSLMEMDVSLYENSMLMSNMHDFQKQMMSIELKVDDPKKINKGKIRVQFSRTLEVFASGQSSELTTLIYEHSVEKSQLSTGYLKSNFPIGLNFNDLDINNFLIKQQKSQGPYTQVPTFSGQLIRVSYKLELFFRTGTACGSGQRYLKTQQVGLFSKRADFYM